MSPSHGEVPGTAAYSMRQADAEPDVILQSPNTKTTFGDTSPGGTVSPNIPVPKTVVTKVDEQPAHGEVPGTEAYDMRTEDATPDFVETKGHASDGGFGRMPEDSDDDSEDEPSTPSDKHNAPGDGFGDDFDDFEAGGGDDDFGDFDEGFEQPSAAPNPSNSEVPSVLKSTFELGDLDSFLLTSFIVVQPPVPFDAFASLDDLLETTKPHLDALFPNTKSTSLQPTPQWTGTSSSLFLTPRSHSLFTQLIAPPPLSPPNWLRSRTRRLFLVSLGVPIDLDEILPKSKQKKLILPSTVRSDSEHRRSESRRRRGDGMKGLKDNNTSSTSVSSQSKDRDRRKRRGGGNDQLPPNPPPLDLPAIHHLCSTTETALQNMTDGELQTHVKRLEEMTKKTGEVLEYWVRRRDAAMGEKEMFESVVGDLVKHARRVRR
ncbi:MAG: hypothetical protein Q9201_002263 [Fulgogasparrea decipioides]